MVFITAAVGLDSAGCTGMHGGMCRKEQLWPHLREFADRGIAHAKSSLLKLADDKTPCELYAVHGHYADAGEVAFLMTSTLGVDMALTGHSLGRNILEQLLSSGAALGCECLHQG